MSPDPTSHAPADDAPFLRAASTQLARTRVEASIEAPISPGTNVLYAGSFGLAWAALEAFAGGPAEVDGVPGFAERVRRASCRPDDLDEDAFLARAVLGPEGLAELRRDLSRKFGGAAQPALLPSGLAAETLLVYAYLFKNLALETPLAKNGPLIVTFGGARVSTFGLSESPDRELWEKRAKQIVVHDHRADDNFVLELLTRAEGDRLIVARIPPGTTLLETVRAVLDRVGERPSFLRRWTGGDRIKPRETVAIPVVDIELSHAYAELAGHTVSPLGRPVAEALQTIRLRLDERGALLKSEVAIGLPKGGFRLPPRRFVCDGPFLVMMLRRGRTMPYLALWVDNPELLRPLPAS
jgi:hypothetical protein